MNKVKRYIALFYLVFFILIKSAGLHSFIHDHEEHVDKCDICEFVITTNTTPFLAFENVSFECPIQVEIIQKIVEEYSFLFYKKVINSVLFCRPPPTIG